MNEEETERLEQEKTEEDNNEGNEQEDLKLIDRAYKIAQRIEKENERAEKILNEFKEAKALKLLGGSSKTNVEKPKTPEISDEEYLIKVMSGEITPTK